MNKIRAIYMNHDQIMARIDVTSNSTTMGSVIETLVSISLTWLSKKTHHKN